jgi:nitrate/nitrite transport system substrate-binding protein
MSMQRRKFLKTTAASTAGVLMSGLPSGWTGGVYAADGPETSTIRFGIIALTDCAPIVMAHELVCSRSSASSPSSRRKRRGR